MNLLVFAGTTEGTDFIEKAACAQHRVTASVATEYGADILHAALGTLFAEKNAVTILKGRMDTNEIVQIAAAFDAIIDATHPYAACVSKNIRLVGCTAGIPCYRLVRPMVSFPYKKLREFKTVAELVNALQNTTGRIFVSTGSRDIEQFTSLPQYTERIFVRVLPSIDSLEKCRAMGIPPDHIIAMQGAFSVALNKALFTEYDCRILVTKESGAAGGFTEKMTAAQDLNMDVYALQPPQEHYEQVFFSAESLLRQLGDK